MLSYGYVSFYAYTGCLLNCLFVTRAWYRPTLKWCSKTTTLQNQDHLIIQDQDKSGEDQDHFFRTKAKTAFLKIIKLLAQDLQKRSLTEKIRPVMLVLSSHAGITPITEQNGFLVKFCFIQN